MACLNYSEFKSMDNLVGACFKTTAIKSQSKGLKMAHGGRRGACLAFGGALGSILSPPGQLQMDRHLEYYLTTQTVVA